LGFKKTQGFLIKKKYARGEAGGGGGGRYNTYILDKFLGERKKPKQTEQGRKKLLRIAFPSEGGSRRERQRLIKAPGSGLRQGLSTGKTRQKTVMRGAEEYLERARKNNAESE